MSLYQSIPQLTVDPSGAPSDPLLGFSLADIQAEFPLFTASFNDAGNVLCLNSIDRPYSLPICSVAPVVWTAPTGGWSTAVYQPPPGGPPPVIGSPEPLWIGVILPFVVCVIYAVLSRENRRDIAELWRLWRPFADPKAGKEER